MRDAVLETLPCWRSNGYVIGVVNTPVGPCINLLRIIRIHDDRVDRNIRKIAGLICPREGTAVGSARYLKYVAGCGGRIRIETAYASVAHRQICSPHGRIESDTQHRAQRHNRVVPSNIHPVRLRLSSSAEIKPDPDVGIVSANHGYALVLRRVLDLVDERTISQSLLGHVLGRWIVRDVPVRTRKGATSAQDRLPYPCGACDEMTAAARNAGCRAVIAAWDTAVEKIVRQNEGSCVAAPAAAAAGDVTAPRSILICAVTDTTMQRTAVITLPEAEA